LTRVAKLSKQAESRPKRGRRRKISGKAQIRKKPKMLAVAEVAALFSEF